MASVCEPEVAMWLGEIVFVPGNVFGIKELNCTAKGLSDILIWPVT